MENGRRVLVVDELTETADVLRAVLEPRGMRVEGSTRPSEDSQSPARTPPAVVVVDEDTAEFRGVDRHNWGDVPRVIIGTVRLPVDSDGNPRERFLQKPFHYADLIREIENLISTDPA